MKASRSQRFPLNLEQTTNTECLPQKVEWLIIMAACFHLVLSASGSCFLKTAVTGELTCEQAHRLQLHIKRLADALILAQWERAHERPRHLWILWSLSESKLYNRWREDGETASQKKRNMTRALVLGSKRTDPITSATCLSSHVYGHGEVRGGWRLWITFQVFYRTNRAARDETLKDSSLFSPASVQNKCCVQIPR